MIYMECQKINPKYLGLKINSILDLTACNLQFTLSQNLTPLGGGGARL